MSGDGGAAAPLVLVVEDHDDTLEMMGLLLDLSGFDVVLARTAEEALALLATRPPALITIDIGLPGISGLELARRVRQHPATQDVPVIAVTGWAAERDVARAMEAGCDAVLTKPCSPEGLHAEIVRLLSPGGRLPLTEEHDWACPPDPGPGVSRAREAAHGSE